MRDSQQHIFTNEFDDLHIAISLNSGTAAPSVQVTMSERNRFWKERVLLSPHCPSHTNTRYLRAFEESL